MMASTILPYIFGPVPWPQWPGPVRASSPRRFLTYTTRVSIIGPLGPRRIPGNSFARSDASSHHVFVSRFSRENHKWASGVKSTWTMYTNEDRTEDRSQSSEKFQTSFQTLHWSRGTQFFALASRICYVGASQGGKSWS